MRESNFQFAAQQRACVCISSALYDRRAIDSPAPSLPLVNSLTHLSYLTATSPRIREILSVDGGLERLVRILKGCATGGPAPIEASLSELKGKGTSLAKGARKSPFRPFSEYASSSKGPQPSAGPSIKTRHLLYTYTLAFQCVVNIGVRGSEQIRTRVVEAGALDVVVHVLERYLEETARRRRELEAEYQLRQAGGEKPRLVEISATEQEPRRAHHWALLETIDAVAGLCAERDPSRAPTPDVIMDATADDTASSSGEGEARSPEMVAPSARVRASSKPGRDGQADEDVEMTSDDTPQPPADDSTPTPRAAPRAPGPERLTYRDEDILLSLQLLAYLSKYPHVRNVFHEPSEPLSDIAFDDLKTPVQAPAAAAPADVKSPAPTTTGPTNVFSLVESFTHRPPTSDRFSPRHSNEVQYWASVIMRNACRKDDSRGGIRQCANMACGAWEKYAREFAKCRRCRKAKYCSKVCQSQAWQRGHRYWCAKASPKEATPAGAEAADGSEESAEGSSRRRERHGVHAHVTGHGHSHGHSHGHGHHSHGHGRHSDEDDEIPPPPPAEHLVSPSIDGSQPGLHPAPHRIGGGPFADNVAVAGAGLDGLRVGEGLDENEVAQEMMGGRGVFGEGQVVGGPVDH